jgi:putative N6-adenine-specific DNA methylase
LRFFASSAAGTEPALREELRELGVQVLGAERGGVGFDGSLELALRVCLWSRVAVRVLLELAEFRCPDGDALYAGVRQIDWSEHLNAKRTLAVSAVSRESRLAHTMFIAQRTKDAIVDSLRDRFGERPNVDRDDPDVAVFVRISRDVASVHLDLAGEALHRRGWREPGAEAPLKETLAAAILRLGKWDRERPLVDPMCGSGTIAIEADHYARKVAPGLSRARFGIERWASFGPELAATLERLREEARLAARPDGPRIVCFDSDPRAVDQTRRNAARAKTQLEVAQARIAELRMGALGFIQGRGKTPAHLITNPPYGERLAAGSELWAELDAALERLPQGTRVSLLLAERPKLTLPRRVERFRLMNGAIKCELVSWDVGRARKH